MGPLLLKSLNSFIQIFYRFWPFLESDFRRDKNFSSTNLLCWVCWKVSKGNVLRIYTFFTNKKGLHKNVFKKTKCNSENKSLIHLIEFFLYFQHFLLKPYLLAMFRLNISGYFNITLSNNHPVSFSLLKKNYVKTMKILKYNIFYLVYFNLITYNMVFATRY